jgi:hypothetical protein
MNIRRTLALVGFVASMSAALAGDFSGQYVLVGSVPELAPAVATCNVAPIFDESLKVDAISKGIANIVVYLPKAPDSTPPIVKKPAPVLDVQGCQFVPRVLTVRVGEVPVVKSNDPFPHNVRSSFVRNKPFNFAIGGVNRVGVPCNWIVQPEPLPMPIRCDIYPHMQAFCMILDHPYVAVTDKDGNFTIKDLPPGKHKFRVWHERAGYVDRSLTIEMPAEGDVIMPVPGAFVGRL